MKSIFYLLCAWYMLNLGCQFYESILMRDGFGCSSKKQYSLYIAGGIVDKNPLAFSYIYGKVVHILGIIVIIMQYIQADTNFKVFGFLAFVSGFLKGIMIVTFLTTIIFSIFRVMSYRKSKEETKCSNFLAAYFYAFSITLFIRMMAFHPYGIS